MLTSPLADQPVQNTLPCAAGARIPARTVFVIGPPRSGTTLISYLLAGGEGVLSLSEPFRLHRVFPNWGLRWTFWQLQRSAGLLRIPPPTHSREVDFLDYMRGLAVANSLSHLVRSEERRVGKECRL